MSIPETIERWAARIRKPLEERIAALTQECDQLRARLALLADPAAVHANILRGALPLTKAQAIHIAGLPANVEEELERLRAEVERLNAPVGDEQAEASFHAWNSVWSNSTRKAQ